jgi:hypothetical protein
VSKVVTDIVADGWSATQLVTQVCCQPFLIFYWLEE